jgi:hypothetical protein
LVSKAKNQKKIIPFVGRYPCDPPTRWFLSKYTRKY